MDIIFLTNSISPHQLPFCTELAKLLDASSMAYLYTEPMSEERLKLGWSHSVDNLDLKIEHWPSKRNRDEVENCELLIADIRDVEIFNKRAKRGASTFYISERWFKPPLGILRLLHPKYFMMAHRLIRLLRSSACFLYLPQGVHAARDMARLCGLFAGDLRCLFRAPKLDFERRPGGRIYIREQGIGNREQGEKYCLDKMRMWGYFVEEGRGKREVVRDETVLRVLWVGRLLNLKRVDTIVRAVGEHANLKRVDNSLPKITLDIYGTGPEETRLKKLAAKYGDCIKFYPPVPIDEVRKLMREHDIYVLASNAYEGWGAVVSEALEEGMKVIGTYEAGSSATILPKECLFKSGDYVVLRKMLADSAGLPLLDKEIWSAKNAATVFAGLKDRIGD